MSFRARRACTHKAGDEVMVAVAEGAHNKRGLEGPAKVVEPKGEKGHKGKLQVQFTDGNKKAWVAPERLSKGWPKGGKPARSTAGMAAPQYGFTSSSDDDVTSGDGGSGGGSTGTVKGAHNKAKAGASSARPLRPSKSAGGAAKEKNKKKKKKKSVIRHKAGFVNSSGSSAHSTACETVEDVSESELDEDEAGFLDDKDDDTNYEMCGDDDFFIFEGHSLEEWAKRLDTMGLTDQEKNMFVKMLADKTKAEAARMAAYDAEIIRKRRRAEQRRDQARKDAREQDVHDRKEKELDAAHKRKMEDLDKKKALEDAKTGTVRASATAKQNQVGTLPGT